jgi:hypothetical protein
MSIDASKQAAPIREVGCSAPPVQPYNGTTLLCKPTESGESPKPGSLSSALGMDINRTKMSANLAWHQNQLFWWKEAPGMSINPTKRVAPIR